MMSQNKWLYILRFLRLVFLSLTCFILWAALSQDFHRYSLLCGALFACIAALYSYQVFYESDVFHRSDFFFRVDLLFVYFIYVLVQSHLSSVELIRMMFSRKYQSGVIRIKTRLQSQVGRVVLANTISLIPGTLSLWVEGQYVFVHWFDLKTTHSIKAGRMIKEPIERVLKRMFG